MAYSTAAPIFTTGREQSLACDHIADKPTSGATLHCALAKRTFSESTYNK